MSNDDGSNQKTNTKSDSQPTKAGDDKADLMNNQASEKPEVQKVAPPVPPKSAGRKFHERITQTNKDTNNMNEFLGPMLHELEKVMAENMKQLEKLEEDLGLGEDIKKRVGPDPAAHIPVAIRGCKSIDTIMKNFEDIIVANNASSDFEIDPSQKKSHDFLQTKLSKTAEYVRERLQEREDREKREQEMKKKQAEAMGVEMPQAKQSEEKEPISEFAGLKTKNIGNITSMAHSLSAHLISSSSQKKDGAKLKNITVKIYDAVNLWLSRLFRFDNSSVLFHEQEVEGLIRMCNVVMNFKFKKLNENGYQAYNLKQPAIYISAASKYALPEYKEIIAVQLNLPMSSIRIVEVSKTNDRQLNKIDIGLFTKQIDLDTKNGFVPLLLVANAGSDNIGQCDDLNKLNTLTTTYRMWLHLEGVYLSSLIMYSVPTEIKPIMSGDSLTIDFGSLIGISSLCHITLYKNRKNTNTYLQPYNNIKSTLYKSLPYWCVLQSIGHEGVIERVRNASDMAYYIHDIVQKHQKYIKVVNFKPRDETTSKNYTLAELFVGALSMLTFVDYTNPIVLFQCDKAYIKERINFFAEGNVDVVEVKKPKKILSQKEKIFAQLEDPISEKEQFRRLMARPEPALEFYDKKKPEPKPISDEEIEFDVEMSEYTDNLTTWLCNLLNSMHKKIELEAFELENNGVCIRYSPMEHANICQPVEYDLHMFSKSLDHIIVIIDASIKCKATLNKQIRTFSNLMPASIPKWAGIGAVRYIPEYLLDKIDDILKYVEYKRTLKEPVEKAEITETSGTVVEVTKTVETSESTAKENDAKEDLKQEEPAKEPTKEHVKGPYDVGTMWDYDKHIIEINDINDKLVKKLQAEDGAFSIGVATDSLKAIKFGMVNESDAVEKLASQVQVIGKEIEENSKYLEKMTGVIREAILKADNDMKKENEAQLTQKGVIRQIPLVGGLFNWIAPLESQKPIGRTLDLESGKFEKTDSYKRKQNADESQKSKLNDQGCESDLERVLEEAIDNTNTNEAFESNELQETKEEQDSSEVSPST